MSSRTQGRHLCLFLRFLAWLPLPVAASIGAIIGSLITRVPLRYASAYRVILINLLATHPAMTLREARVVGRRAMKELARSVAEFAHVWLRPVHETLERVSAIHGEQAYLQACASDRPVLLLSLHQGSWETINLYLGHQPNTTIMYQPYPSTLVDSLVKSARERTGSRLVPANNQGVKKALSILRQGGTLGLLSDHNPGNRSNPCVPFFGHRVPTPALVDKLVRRFRPHVFLVSCYRGEGGLRDIRIHFEPAPGMEQAEDETTVLAALNAGLEACIRRSPTQYQWSYKRFKWGPDGRRHWYRYSYPLLKRVARGESRETLGLAPPTGPSGA